MAERIPVGAKAPQTLPPARSGQRLPMGAVVGPPIAPKIPGATELAWLALLPTAAPALTTAELGLVRGIRDGSADPRVKARATQVLIANGTNP